MLRPQRMAHQRRHQGGEDLELYFVDDGNKDDMDQGKKGERTSKGTEEETKDDHNDQAAEFMDEQGTSPAKNTRRSKRAERLRNRLISWR